MKSKDTVKYRVGIIGCGNHGTRFARSFDLHPLTEIAAGVNPSRETLDLFCRRFGVPGYHDYRDMLEHERIDIAVPILPVKYNPEVVIGCAQAGIKAILCEKPIAVSLEEADRMVAECRDRNIPLGSGDMFRNAPEIWKARKIVESGRLGEVQSINVYSTGGTQASGQGCRGYTEMAMFAGDGEIDHVIGWVDGNPADSELGPKIDAFSDHDQGMGGCIRYVNGIEAYIHNRVTGRSGIEVICSRGVLTIDQSRTGYVWERKAGRLERMESLFPADDPAIKDLDGAYDEEGWVYLRTRLTDSTQGLIDALEKGIEPRCSGNDLRKALEVVIALRESHRNGSCAVKLPLKDRSLKIIPQKGRYLGRRLHADYSTEQWWDKLKSLKLDG